MGSNLYFSSVIYLCFFATTSSSDMRDKVKDNFLAISANQSFPI